MSNDMNNELNILDELADLPEPVEQPTIELTDEQIQMMDENDIQKMFTDDKETAPEEPVTPAAQDDAPEPEEPVIKDEPTDDDFSPREKGLYAQKQKYKSRADELAAQNEELQRRLEAVEQKVNTPVQEEEEAPDPDDYLTVNDFERALERTIEKRQRQQAEQLQERVKAADNIGRDFYEDYDDIVTPETIAAVKRDPKRFQDILSQPTEGRMARAAYDACKQIMAGEVAPKDHSPPKQPTIKNPAPKQAPEMLKAHHVAYLQEKIHNCSEDEIAELQRQLAAQYGIF